MSGTEYFGPEGEILCMKCKVLLEPADVMLEYAGSAFPVSLPVCPVCRFVYIPEQLALDRMLRVERSLEDK